MNRAVVRVIGLSISVVLGALPIGCVQFNDFTTGLTTTISSPFLPVTEEQKLEKELDIGVVGDITAIENGGFIQVSGVGIVMGLEGTGGTGPGPERELLAQQLRKQKIENTKKLLDDPNNALVLVTAFLHAGVRRGELIDVEITLPKQSPATSLKGGILAECPLRNYENQRNLSSERADKLLPGHVLAIAEGPLVVGIGKQDDAKEIRRARIWSGAASKIERPYYFVLTKDDMKSAKVTSSIAARINLQFQDDARKQKIAHDNIDLVKVGEVTSQINKNFEGDFGKGEIAKATNKEMIGVRVPYAYRYNQERFLRVARLLPLSVPQPVMNAYREKLDTMLQDPKHTVRAALRLEALGKESIPSLRKGLDSSDALVRFCSAESLAYLGHTAGIEDLAKLAVERPEMRAYALIAIASLDESICRQKLGELLTVDDDELRSGAFRALRLLDEKDVRLGEDFCGNFALHRVAGGSASLVTFATNKRAEVVLFGPEPTIKTPVKVLAGTEFTITADAGDDRVFITRVRAGKSKLEKPCTLELEDTIRTMVELGAGYADVVDLLKGLQDQRAVSTNIVLSAPPAAGGIGTLLPDSAKEAKLPSAE